MTRSRIAAALMVLLQLWSFPAYAGGACCAAGGGKGHEAAEAAEAAEHPAGCQLPCCASKGR